MSVPAAARRALQRVTSAPIGCTGARACSVLAVLKDPATTLSRGPPLRAHACPWLHGPRRPLHSSSSGTPPKHPLPRSYLKVAPALFADNRRRVVERLLASVTAAAADADAAPSAAVGTHVLLLQGAPSATRHDTDSEPLFRQESNFLYVTGVREPDFHCAITVDVSCDDGAGGASTVTTLYMPRHPPSYAVWMGDIATPEQVRTKYGVDRVRYVDEMGSDGEDWAARGASLHLMHCMHPATPDYDGDRVDVPPYGLHELSVAYSPRHGDAAAAIDSTLLCVAVSESRVHKSEAELEVMRYACRLSADAHVECMRHARPGMHESELEALFCYSTYTRGGARTPAYTPIVASGSNAATLHYGHAGAPNDRVMRDGDLVLMDMGAEYCGYGADITVTFPVSGTFTEPQKVVYGAVLAASRAVLAAIRPGVLWRDLQTLAYRSLLEELGCGGLLSGDIDAMMAANLGATFMPHGLGHFLGLDTHDVGGYLQGSTRDERAGYAGLRMDRVLEEGMVVTVEPGVYFNSHTMREALGDDTLRSFIDQEALAQYWSPDDADACMGGVRIEDNVVVTSDGCEVLTAGIPRDVDEVEALMARGESWG